MGGLLLRRWRTLSAIAPPPHAVRTAVHAFVRPPLFHTIPSTGPNGVLISRDGVMTQFRDFYKTLQHSALVDKLHVMSERPVFESIRVADQLVSIGSTFLAMPPTGLEHRVTEWMETARYLRAAGGPTTLAGYLQDVDNLRCSSGDIVVLPTGIAVAHGSRTNAEAHQVLKQLFTIQDDHSNFEVLTLEQETDAPPLGDYFGFAGNNLLIAWKDEHGLLAVNQYQKLRPNDTLQTVFLEPGCHFFSFFGTDATNDIIVQRGYDRSIESLIAHGLNPIPVQWSEMDKLGVSMRSAVLIARFLKVSVAGGLQQRTRLRGSRWQAHQLTGTTSTAPIQQP